MKNVLVKTWAKDTSVILILKNHNPAATNRAGVPDTRYASLSWGVFDEEIRHKPVERYGRIYFDTKTKKITQFATEQSLYNDYNFDPVVFAMNVDPLAHKFPWQSPYSCFGNNPIYNIDVDGAYQYPGDKAAGYRSRYPLLTRYLAEYVQKDIQKSKIVQKAVVENTYGGYTQKELVNTIAAWGNKNSPEITFEEGLAEKTNAYGHTNDSKHFQIDAGFADAMEKILGNKNSSTLDKQAAMASFYSTLLDETTHTGDLKDGSRSADEVGKDATLKIFWGKKYEDENGEFWVNQIENDDPVNKSNLAGTKQMVERIVKEGKSEVLPTIPKK